MNANVGIHIGDPIGGDALVTLSPWAASAPTLGGAVLLLLGTDRRAEPGELRGGEIDPRGWWGDDHGGPVGSRLWLLLAQPATAEAARLAETYAAEALRPLVDDGIASRIDCRGSLSRDGVEVDILITRPDGSVVQQSLRDLWAALREGS